MVVKSCFDYENIFSRDEFVSSTSIWRKGQSNGSFESITSSKV